MRILVVENDPEICHSIAAMLQKEGFRVQTDDGDDAERNRLRHDQPSSGRLPWRLSAFSRMTARTFARASSASPGSSPDSAHDR